MSNVITDVRRAALPFSRVTVYNSSEVQTHVVIDRFYQGHTLRPGERKHDIEMPNDQIRAFQEQRCPDRLYPSTDPNKPSIPKPLHPILIEGVGSMLEDRYE